MAVNLEDVVKLAEQLDPTQQNLLIYRLRVKQMRQRPEAETAQPALTRRYFDVQQESYRSPSREDLIRETEGLRDTPPRPDDSLLGKYANPNVPETSAEIFHADMHAIVTEWEQELDEFYNDES
ncbi:MAG: hypothetical protein D6737_13030 [Chloroflexi bacterium]|nr:MAG: hypothetical protein D6737_13030 [Chloroflexota bacterium]